jgi:magnesium-transporting ATPase (P-type)
MKVTQRSAPPGTAPGLETADEGPALGWAATSPLDQVLAELNSGTGGLTEDEAGVRLRRSGPNLLPEPRGPGLVRQLVGQLTHFFALLLWGAAGLAFIGRLPQLAWAIIVVVVVNGGFSFVQEYRAERATRALRALLPTMATVLRDGRRRSLPAEELVPGDVVLLAEGDRVSADARLLTASALAVDNSLLTGESEPVPRDTPAPAESPADPTAASDLVFAGTFVVSGAGRAVTLATGGHTRLGAISRMTGEVSRRPSPLRIDLNRSVRAIAVLAIASGLALFGISLPLGTPVTDGFLFGVGVIVALVPEGLLPTLTLSLAMSARGMARRRALVRHLEAVETLGSTTVICSDKTGTLTANQMTARAISLPGGPRYHATGTGYDPAGTLLAGDRPLRPAELKGVEDLLRAAALCVDARVEEREGRWRCVGDPTEGALLILAAKGGVTRQEAERVTPRTLEFPFSAERRRMSTVHALHSGAFEIFAKGSPEAILDVCESLRTEDGPVPLDQHRRAEVSAEVETLAADGLRVLALASRVAERPGPSDAATAERGLELLGLVGMQDPVRPEVPEAIIRCRQAGIRVLMVTGDHPATAAAIATKAGLPAERVLLGSELPESDRELADILVSGVAVLARIVPEQKLRVAKALQIQGEVVAMTGDGVNDAPALRQADIGVAMGAVGTDVARAAADVVLLDDNFAHIVEAVEEGRAAFDNIRRFLTYHLTDNVAELAPFVIWALSAGRFPLVLSVLQILALDIGTDLLPALALGAERPEPDAMRRPPRARSARSLDRWVLARAFGFLGPLEAAVSLALVPIGAAIFLDWRPPGQPFPDAGASLALESTLVFVAIVAMQMANAFECRSTRSSLWSIGPLSNRLLVGAVAVEGLALLAFVYLPPLRHALGQTALAPLEWIPVLIAPWLLIAGEETRKVVARGRGSRLDRAHPPRRGGAMRRDGPTARPKQPGGARPASRT